MSKLKFSDGEEFELDAPLHLELRDDGWYVVGNNTLVAVSCKEEGELVILQMLQSMDK